MNTLRLSVAGVLYTYADGDVAHGTRTKKKGGRLRGGRTRHAAACAGPDPLAAPMGGARKLGRGRAQVAQDLGRRPNVDGVVCVLRGRAG